MQLVGELRERGCGFVEVTAGYTTPRFRPHFDPYYLSVLSEQIRNESGVPTLIGGGNHDDRPDKHASRRSERRSLHTEAGSMSLVAGNAEMLKGSTG